MVGDNKARYLGRKVHESRYLHPYMDVQWLGGHSRCAWAQKEQGHSPTPAPIESALGAGIPAAPGPQNTGATRPPPPPSKVPRGRAYQLRPAPKQQCHSPAPSTVESAPGAAIPAAPGPKNGGATRPHSPLSKAPRGRAYQMRPGPKRAGPLARPCHSRKRTRGGHTSCARHRFRPSAPPRLAGGLENAGRAHLDHPWRLPCLLDRKPAAPQCVTALHLSLLPVGSSVSTLTTTLSGTFWLTLLSLPKLFGALSGLPAFIWSFVAVPLVSLPVPDHKMAAIRQTLLTTARLTRAGHIADPNHFQKYDRLRAAFFAKRDRLGYSGDGPGLIYIVALFKKADGVPSFKNPTLNIKGGLTQPDRMERRRTEYRKCEEDNAYVWICTYEVSRHLYCERLLHLTLLRDRATRDRTPCKCGVSHREYFNFLSIGGLSRLHATTVSVLKLMGEPIRRKFFPPPSDDTKAVYDLIRAT
ncbi:hypothetical protein B0H14DRAFT_3517916 [Mycena olivaceomarginata]|nr:hypothetical protein B0H14DRAFT_3517916 [Mycena olivaceomarginata]